MSEEQRAVEPEEQGLADDLGMAEHGGGHRRAKKKRRGFGCLVMLVLLGLLVAAMYVGLTRGVDWAKDYFADPEDYPGPGTGVVLIEVSSGETATDIATTLEDKDVVASAEAFIDIATSRAADASRIQAGFYELRARMSAADALAVLADPANLKTVGIVIPEGFRVVDVIDRLVKETGFKKAEFQAALRNPAALGLPPYAGGRAEGYLFPATYAFAPNDTPATMLKAMVTRWRQAATDADLEGAAKRLGKTPAELMIIASLVEAEGRGEDMPKIARVIYNRLDGPGDKGGTNGLLQIDASVNYGLNRKLGVSLTPDQKAVDTPYNLYLHTGLPPTPIEAPGDDAIRAALEPAEGPWYYYVTVNLKTGETKFAETYEEHQRNHAELRRYCETSDAC